VTEVVACAKKIYDEFSVADRKVAEGNGFTFEQITITRGA
jgi:hypothetical protein